SIRLADVLLAIASELPRSDSYFVDADGGFHEWFSPKGRLDLRTVARWDLTKDLDHQSKECKEFLIDLLVNE
ncbi:MAG TPA: hypothetical protein VLJ61_10240, partial [Pyrinomonadaceae bacterium]|nr:hypothetical protein [Pyrinomonadaceae bacterium]